MFDKVARFLSRTALKNTLIGIVVFETCSLIIVLVHFGYPSTMTRKIKEEQKIDMNLYNLSLSLMEQRNNIARQLNLKQMKLGQMECERDIARNKRISETGGWCRQQSTDEHHVTDRQFVNVLASFFSEKRVASFGDGSGTYKQLIMDTGKVKVYDAYDGAPFSDVTSNGRVQFLDLSLPQYGLPLYDWIISLEVAEHIPTRYESTYIDNIVRHAREGVVISWAVPGQGGLGHVNNRPFEYVKHLFESLRFFHDKVDSQKLKAGATLEWLKANTNVFKRKNLSEADQLMPFFT